MCVVVLLVVSRVSCCLACVSFIVVSMCLRIEMEAQTRKQTNTQGPKLIKIVKLQNPKDELASLSKEPTDLQHCSRHAPKDLKHVPQNQRLAHLKTFTTKDN